MIFCCLQREVILLVVVHITSLCALDFKLQINTNEIIHQTDERFLSVALGATIIRNNWSKLNLSAPRVLTLASALAPAILRLGGSQADQLSFDNTTTENRGHNLYTEGAGYSSDYDYEKDLSNFTMTATQWDQLNTFSRRVGWNLLFDLNVLLRRRGQWDPTNALQLLLYSIQKNYTSNLHFELGNEPNAFKIYINKTVGPEALGRDFVTLSDILRTRPGIREHFTHSRLYGPDTTSPRHKRSRVLQYMIQFLKTAGDKLSAITWHQYYISGRTARLSDFLDPAVLEVFRTEAGRVWGAITAAGMAHKPLVLGETGSCWGGGAPGLSDRYVAGVMWLDKLGLAAQLGHSVVIRQTFYDGHYSLIDRDLNPLPDYWLSLVFKRLVGTKVFNTSITDTSGRTRVYAHCTNTHRSGYQPGALTVYIVNIQSSPVSVDITSLPSTKHVYWFLPHKAGDLTSKLVSINGKKMKMLSDTRLPDIVPVVTKDTSLVLPPTSFGFVVFPDAKLTQCGYT